MPFGKESGMLFPLELEKLKTMLNMLNFGAKTKSIMVFLKKAIPEIQKPSLSKQGEVENLSCVICKRELASFWNRGLGQLGNGDGTLPRSPPHFDLMIELGHAGFTNIKRESKNEMNSGSFSKIKSSWKWSLVLFTLACSLYFSQKQKNKNTWFISSLKNFTYSNEKEWSGWVKQHTLNETFSFLERTLVSEKKIKVEKMQTPLEKKGCIKNTWLRRFVIWWINTDLLPPMRKNIREWGKD